MKLYLTQLRMSPQKGLISLPFFFFGGGEGAKSNGMGFEIQFDTFQNK